MAISLACMSLSILLAMPVLKLWLSCLSMSQFLACCSALCIFEKHILALCILDSCITNKGEESTQFMFLGGVIASREEKSGEMHLFRGELAFMHLGALFHLNFSCALLLMVSSPFVSP
jgi:hypothetical protein